MLEIKSDDNLLLLNLMNNTPNIARSGAKKISQKETNSKNLIKQLEFDYPFDQQIIKMIEEILPLKKNDSLYTRIEELKKLWFILVDKSIKCLRYFDYRSGRCPAAGAAVAGYRGQCAYPSDHR